MEERMKEIIGNMLRARMCGIFGQRRRLRQEHDILNLVFWDMCPCGVLSGICYYGNATLENQE